ncbi:MAG TPA: type II secretion system F family protein [Vitreimonas sp.]|nr:type II secretion system F family protein [Vitreimonas sp.]
MNISLNQKIQFFSHVTLVEKALFTKHLATLIHAGIPLAEALATLHEDQHSTLNTIIGEMQTDIENGLSLAATLHKHPQAFDNFYVSMIEVGETAGTLEETLSFLSNHLSKEYILRQKINGAMMYPGVVFFATLIMSGFIALFVLPKLTTFFDAFEIELPLSTQILLAVANFMSSYGIAFFAGVIGVIALVIWLLQLPMIKPHWHRIVLKTPLFGKLLQYTQIARFTRNLSVLLKSGVPITQSLAVTTHTLSNVVIQHDIERLVNSLKAGTTMGKALKEGNYPRFPQLMKKMIAVGEKTGKLEDTLHYVAEFYEEEIDTVSKNLSTILEPVLLIVIGLVVGFVALAIIGPIYNLTGSIGR